MDVPSAEGSVMPVKVRSAVLHAWLPLLLTDDRSVVVFCSRHVSVSAWTVCCHDWCHY